MRCIRRSSTPPLAVTLSLLAAGLSAQAGEPTGPDAAHVALRARAEAPAETPAAGADMPGSGNALFTFVGTDNADCVRSVSDVNSDGLDDVLVGINKSGVDNVFLLDGASSGAASVLWSFQTSDGVSGGAPYGDQSLTPSSDADGNGLPNFLLGTAWGGRTAYGVDASAGAQLWKVDTYNQAQSGWVYSLCELGDIDGNGSPEVAFGTGSFNDSVQLVDGANAGGEAPTVLWSWYAGDAVYSVRNIGDVNGDGDDDVLAAVGDDVDVLYCLSGGTALATGEVLWSYDPGIGITVWACGVLPDVNGDGIDDALAVLWTLAGSSIRCLSGATGALLWSSTQVPQYGQMVDVIEDVNGDGQADVVVGSWENAVIVLDGSDGSLLWKTKVGTLNGGDVWTVRAIDDLNGDGRQDVIAGSFDYHVYALDGDSGEVFWAYDTGNRVFSVYPVGDLNGDGRPEVVAGTQDTTNLTVVHVLEGDAGIPFPGLTLAGRRILGTQLRVELTGTPGLFGIPLLSTGTASVNVPGITGTLGLAAPLGKLPVGLIGPGGTYTYAFNLPSDPKFVGMVFYFQGLVFSYPPLSGALTDVETLQIGAG